MSVSNKLQEMNEMRSKLQLAELRAHRIEMSVVTANSLKILPHLIASGMSPAEASKKAIEAAVAHVTACLEFEPGVEKVLQSTDELSDTVSIMREVFLEHHENCGNDCPMTEYLQRVREAPSKIFDLGAYIETLTTPKG
jgi:hypothetical protein